MFSSITAAHWHLLFNHLPVVGVMGATLLLFYGMMRKSSEVVKASLWAFTLVAICAWLSDITGGPAGGAIKGIAAVNRADIREHAQAANFALITSIALGVLSIIGLILGARRKETAATTTDKTAWYVRYYKAPPKWVVIACLLIGLLDCTIMMRVSYLGGLIRHPEISTSAPTPTQGAPNQTTSPDTTNH